MVLIQDCTLSDKQIVLNSVARSEKFTEMKF